MAFSFGDDHEVKREYDGREWFLLLAYIGAKRTREPAFRKLFDKILEDEGHEFHGQARLLRMRYDFTPLDSVTRVPPATGSL